MNNILYLIIVGLLWVIFDWMRNPEKIEKANALLHKFLKFVRRKSEYTYIKYDIQGSLNSYISKVRSKVDHITSSKAVINWIDTDTDQGTFINNGKLVLRMRKSENQNQNLVNACVAFVSHSFLRPAKSYIAKYQREALDMYVCYDLLKEERREILNQFADDFLKDKLDNDKVSEFFDSFFDIDKASLLYPIFVQELSYLGEKVFTKKKNYGQIHTEVKELTKFLKRYADRKSGDDHTPSEYTGNYSCFAIRIIGKPHKIDIEGKRVYVNNLNKLSNEIETIYIIANPENKIFVKDVINDYNKNNAFDIIRRKTYDSIIKDRDGNDKKVKRYMILLRKSKTNIIRRN